MPEQEEEGARVSGGLRRGGMRVKSGGKKG